MATFFIEDPVEGILELTSTTSINIEEKSTVSKHKVESGFKIADNVVTENVKISFEGVISDIRTFSFTGQDQNPRKNKDRDVDDYVKSLRRIKENKSVFSVIYDVAIGVVENCVLSSLSIKKDKSIGLGWRVNLAFEQVRISERSKITTNRSVESNSDLTQEKTDSGATQTKKIELVGGASQSTIFLNATQDVLTFAKSLTGGSQ